MHTLHLQNLHGRSACSLRLLVLDYDLPNKSQAGAHLETPLRLGIVHSFTVCMPRTPTYMPFTHAGAVPLGKRI